MPCLSPVEGPDVHDERRELAAALRSSDGARRAAARELAADINAVYLGPAMKLADEDFRVRPAAQQDLFSTSPDPTPDRPPASPPEDRVAQAAKQRDEALAAAERPQNDGWRADADPFLRRYLETHPTMHVDELWAAGMPEPPGSRKAIGAVIVAAAHAGLMEKTGEYRPSVASNLSVKPVWRSLIYRRPVAA